MTNKIRRVRVEEYTIVSTNFAKTLVWKHEYDVKLLGHKDCTPQTNDHHMPRNETPRENFLRTPLSWCT